MLSGKSRLISLVILVSITLTLSAQEENSSISAKGYLSAMQSQIFEKFDSDWTGDNLLHNRLNFRIYAGGEITFGLEVRNRVFTGDMLRLNPDYPEMIGADNGWLDMSWNIIDENSLLVNTFIDRLWIDVSGDSYQLRIGRQRINWGQTFVWNPNDVFNAYSYFDFDYAERPGSDAVRLQIFPNYSSTVEFAANVDSDDNLTAAALYRFNKWGYDIQFLGAYVSGEDWVVGTGWSGAFGSTSFRGEFSWFQPDQNFSDTTGTGLFTVGFDRSFSNNSMIQFQAMYCNSPLDFNDFESFYSGKLSAKDLAFSELSFFAGIQVPATPLLNIGLSGIYYPGLNGFFAGPTLDASLSENVDLSFFWQYFNAEMGGSRTKMNMMFLRFKYSF